MKAVLLSLHSALEALAAGSLLMLSKVLIFLLLCCPRQSGMMTRLGRNTLFPYLLHHPLLPLKNACLVLLGSSAICILLCDPFLSKVKNLSPRPELWLFPPPGGGGCGAERCAGGCACEPASSSCSSGSGAVFGLGSSAHSGSRLCSLGGSFFWTAIGLDL